MHLIIVIQYFYSKLSCKIIPISQIIKVFFQKLLSDIIPNNYSPKFPKMLPKIIFQKLFSNPIINY